MVELEEYDGVIFFNKSIYNFNDIEYNNVKTERTFKRYLQINPNLIQTMINYDKTFPDKQMDSALKATDVHLGLADEPVWEKRFKMRITSKNSGKKFDINFTCKKRFIKPENPPIDPGVIASIAKTSQGLQGLEGQDISSAVMQTFGEQEETDSSRGLGDIDFQETFEPVETVQVDTERLEQIQNIMGRTYNPK